MKRQELQQNLATTVLLTSLGMLFATLFMGYTIYRTSTPAWPPAGQSRADLLIPTLSTLIIALSSWFIHLSSQSVKKAQLNTAQKNLFITIFLGWGFVASQAYLWQALKAQGLYVSSGIFASIMHAFTWIHAAHMLVGLAGLHYLAWRMGRSNETLSLLSANIEKFWHFLGIIWLLMYLIIFVF